MSFEKSSVSPFVIEQARNGMVTATENKVPLHSKYNPQREAEQLVAEFNDNEYAAAVFFSAGLGYGAIAFAQNFPEPRSL